MKRLCAPEINPAKVGKSALLRSTSGFARHPTAIADLTLPHPQSHGSYRVLSVSAEPRSRFSKKCRSGRQFQQSEHALSHTANVRNVISPTPCNLSRLPPPT